MDETFLSIILIIIVGALIVVFSILFLENLFRKKTIKINLDQKWRNVLSILVGIFLTIIVLMFLYVFILGLMLSHP